MIPIQPSSKDKIKDFSSKKEKKTLKINHGKGAGKPHIRDCIKYLCKAYTSPRSETAAVCCLSSAGR